MSDQLMPSQKIPLAEKYTGVFFFKPCLNRQDSGYKLKTDKSTCESGKQTYITQGYDEFIYYIELRNLQT